MFLTLYNKVLLFAIFWLYAHSNKELSSAAYYDLRRVQRLFNDQVILAKTMSF